MLGFRCWLVAGSWFGSGVLWFPLCGLVRFDAIVLRFWVGGCFSFGFGVVGVWAVGFGVVVMLVLDCVCVLGGFIVAWWVVFLSGCG